MTKKRMSVLATAIMWRMAAGAAEPEKPITSDSAGDHLRSIRELYLGPATYGQLTNFNLDCVTVGIHKLGDSTFNRNWQIAQGSIIANTGKTIEEIHPIIIEGKGHIALSNVESFSGPNGALSTLNRSQDFLLVRGIDKNENAFVYKTNNQ
ncbi:MAG: hypothetical protein JW720_04570 [Sedimentisphaerales bacterium]|nr:hypothetical protein [Sedimentisphaerales bacterium]